MPRPHSRDPLAAFVETRIAIPTQVETAAQDAIQSALRNADPGGSLLSFLHGEWLHEPLHAVLTDIPVGAWTITVAADAISGVSESRAMEKVADVSLAIGLVGAAGAALTGMADWSEIRRPAPRRIGFVHALLNIGAT